MMTELEKKLKLCGLIPVIKITDASSAVPLAKALTRGGLAAAEVTFRTDAAKESIRLMREVFPELLIGAGTVLSPEQADDAISVGADFIVSPGLNPTVVSHCLAKGYPVIPGCATPSDVEIARSFGLKTVKFFPAEAAGGIKMIRAMSAPYGDMMFMPTGGITTDNMQSYLSHQKVLCCGGSFMVKDEWLRDQKYDEIEKASRAALLSLLNFRLAHIGLNCENEAEAASTAKFLLSAFGFPITEYPGAFFADNKFEILKTPFRGKYGHIGIATSSVDRAVFYLSRLGIVFDETSVKVNEKGDMTVAYVKDDVAGFAFHVVRSEA